MGSWPWAIGSISAAAPRNRGGNYGTRCGRWGTRCWWRVGSACYSSLWTTRMRVPSGTPSSAIPRSISEPLPAPQADARTCVSCEATVRALGLLRHFPPPAPAKPTWVSCSARSLAPLLVLPPPFPPHPELLCSKPPPDSVVDRVVSDASRHSSATHQAGCTIARALGAARVRPVAATCARDEPGADVARDGRSGGTVSPSAWAGRGARRFALERCLDTGLGDLYGAETRAGQAADHRTYRPADMLASNHPLRGIVQELQARRQCEELRVMPLEKAAIGEYLHSRFGELALSEELIATLARRTDGNPLFFSQHGQ